jgi:hypothetical protein
MTRLLTELVQTQVAVVLDPDDGVVIDHGQTFEELEPAVTICSPTRPCPS